MGSVPRVYPAVEYKILELLENYHPKRRDIYFVVRKMNNIGLDQNLITATLNLQKWKTIYGGHDWKVDDIKEVIDG